MLFQCLNRSSFKSWGLRHSSFHHTSISIKYSASSALCRVGLQGPSPTPVLNDIFFSIVGVSWAVEWTGQRDVLAINHSWQQAGQAFIWQQHGLPQRQKVVIIVWQQLATPALPLVEHVSVTTWHRLPADYWTKRQSWHWNSFHCIPGLAWFLFIFCLRKKTISCKCNTEQVRGNKSLDFGQFPVNFMT